MINTPSSFESGDIKRAQIEDYNMPTPAILLPSSSSSNSRARYTVKTSRPDTAAMASSESSTTVGEMESSLERVRRQLSSTSSRHLLQGPLLKRSDTLRKWNDRWVILDPATGKMEYKICRSDAALRGIIVFDSTSTVMLSPMNFHGLPKYDGCCFYIGTPQKKEYFLCAETPSAARAWVSTLHNLLMLGIGEKPEEGQLQGDVMPTIRPESIRGAITKKSANWHAEKHKWAIEEHNNWILGTEARSAFPVSKFPSPLRRRRALDLVVVHRIRASAARYGRQLLSAASRGLSLSLPLVTGRPSPPSRRVVAPSLPSWGWEVAAWCSAFSARRGPIPVVVGCAIAAGPLSPAVARSTAGLPSRLVFPCQPPVWLLLHLWLTVWLVSATVGVHRLWIHHYRAQDMGVGPSSSSSSSHVPPPQLIVVLWEEGASSLLAQS
ncbi:hypothetical protein GUJ93_ZPchr0007g5738 [Zizania palustris]|uniref:PH domain-containing protein n=1 Tax=Zizania palustris TaxID=103762 RepID=A0A8J5W6M6_ZIZPA|nr:hypothetical protein GUJ93_ZPchr0007g5738 [Zizania palustris]